MKATIFATAANIGLASAWWRMECQGRVGLARIDPLVTFGAPSQHLHAIHGSSGFGVSATYEDLRNAPCTSCRVRQDKSNYWTPALLFQDEATGQFESVNQVGGMLAYYKFPPDPSVEIRAFPKDFRMIAGDARRRTYTAGDPSQPDPPSASWAGLGQTKQEILAQRALGFNCLNYGRKPEDSLYRHFLPDKNYLDANCEQGIRLELSFPSCWNGQKDSPNHKDHVAYPDLIDGGPCPADFPIRMPQLFYEVIWDTNVFRNRKGRFVLANGDTLGYGYHGDFFMGWDENFLQEAIDKCRSDTGLIGDCPLFDIQSEEESRQCQITLPSQLANENVVGPIPSLPGNVAITYDESLTEGPAPPSYDAPPAPAPAAAAPTLAYSEGSKPSGVYGDAAYAGILQESSAAPAPEPSSEAPPPPPAPATTPAPEPAAESPAEDGVSFYKTEYVTAGNIVSKILWVEEVAYVTEYEDVTVTTTLAAAPTAAKMRRHVHEHLKRHVHGHHH